MRFQGKSSEYAFAAAALARSFMVLWPSGDVSYDVVLEKDGVMSRVQVKSCLKPSNPNSGRYDVQIAKRSGKTKQHYTKKDADFLAIHLVKDNSWYILPINKKYPSNLCIYAYPKMAVNTKHKEFWEAWDQLCAK